MQKTDIPQSDLLQKVLQLEKENSKLRKQLEQVEKAKIEYLQNVSHQLVAPLNAMKWHIENLTEQRISIERARKVLRSIYSQATIAVHLAKNFRLMSNLEGDQSLVSLKEPLQEINLQRLLVNLADDFQPLAWEQSIKIVMVDEKFDRSPSVLAIKPLISQVFSNIIENAVKYSDGDSIISLTGKYMQSSNLFAVSIANRGIPLTKEHQEKLFTRGFRSEEAKSKYPPGTGFGLYIAKKIAEIHKGAIQAEAIDGQVVFTVTLPAKVS
jgi:signal transduction histidine kinase